MSAALRAAASFTPSPVMATTAPPACRARTSSSFCWGNTRANTETAATASDRAASDRAVPVALDSPAWAGRSAPQSTGPGGSPA